MTFHAPLEIFAYHEAGHVVIDVAMGVTVEGALIHEIKGGRTDVAGFDDVDVEDLSTEECRALLGPAMVGLLAGPYAEERLTGEFETETAALDLHGVAQLGFHCVDSFSDWPEFEAGLSAKARNAVNEHWDSISALASELQSRRTMTADEIRDWFVNHPIDRSR